MSTLRASPVISHQIGARVVPGAVSYRIWAPDWPSLAIVLSRPGEPERRVSLTKHGDVFEGMDELGRAGDLYHYETPDGHRLPDVASRFQPEGVHGPSEVIDPLAYSWSTLYWKRPPARGLVIYEMHIGTFTPDGSFRAAIERLDHVVSLGATAVQLMPVADFPGKANWGYDGVALFAPSRRYGRPDDFRGFIDAAHARGLAVILDVVYNHAGPEGSYLGDFAKDYFHHGRKNIWGAGFNLDGPRSEHVRGFMLQNAAMWLDEYRVDGLRLDATHAIVDESETHIIAEIATLAHARGAFVIAEDERSPVELLTTCDGGGCHVDSVWSDDFHHSVRVAVTGTREEYFKAYDGTPGELAGTLKHGWTYRGEPSADEGGKIHGDACMHLPPFSFIFCIENHDQVGNRAHGERLAHLTDADKYRAASALLCLCPYTPMLFMGQEWAATTPFLFFSDFSPAIGKSVRQDRIAEFKKNGLNMDESVLATMPEPQDPATYAKSRLSWSEITEPAHAAIFSLYQECLRWRRTWLAGEASERAYWKIVHADGCVAIRYTPPRKPEWLLVATLRGGAPVVFLDDLAPPPGRSWQTAFHTLESRFGGTSEAVIASRYFAEEALALTAPATIVLHAGPAA